MFIHEQLILYVARLVQVQVWSWPSGLGTPSCMWLTSESPQALHEGRSITTHLSQRSSMSPRQPVDQIIVHLRAAPVLWSLSGFPVKKILSTTWTVSLYEPGLFNYVNLESTAVTTVFISCPSLHWRLIIINTFVRDVTKWLLLDATLLWNCDRRCN